MDFRQHMTLPDSQSYSHARGGE